MELRDRPVPLAPDHQAQVISKKIGQTTFICQTLADYASDQQSNLIHKFIAFFPGMKTLPGMKVSRLVRKPYRAAWSLKIWYEKEFAPGMKTSSL